MKGVRIKWSRHVDLDEVWARNGFKIGYNFSLHVDNDVEGEFEKFLIETEKTSTLKVLNRTRKDGYTRILISVADDNDAVQFKLSVL